MVSGKILWNLSILHFAIIDRKVVMQDLSRAFDTRSHLEAETRFSLKNCQENEFIYEFWKKV